MSLIDLELIIETNEVVVTIDPLPSVELTTVSSPDVIVLAAGNVGPPGPAGSSGHWESMTQAEYDALTTKDPDTLYIIIG